MPLETGELELMIRIVLQNVSSRVLPKWIYIVTPLREAVRTVSDRVTTWIVGDLVARENILQPDELKTLLEEGEETGIIDATERVLIDNLLEASDIAIAHVMTPGPRIRFLDAALPLPELIDTFRQFRHPRVPVSSGHWDNVIGFLHSEDVLRMVIHTLRFFSYLFYPLIFVFSRVARFATRLIGGTSSRHDLFITREELSVLLDITDPGTGAGKVDRRSIRRIIRFADTTVGQAMIPLADVIGFNEVRGTGDAVRIVLKHGFNRLPIYQGNITNVKGVLTLSTWDLLDESVEERSMSDFVRPPLYLSPQQTIDQTLPLLQAREDHMGIVVDEFGSAIGIITMEDVFEEVVGDIDVGYDFDEYQSKRQYFIESDGDNAFTMSGRSPISEVNDKLHIRLAVSEAHTIGGLVIARLRRIPHPGDAIEDEGFRFSVLDADPRTVLQVRAERV